MILKNVYAWYLLSFSWILSTSLRAGPHLCSPSHYFQAKDKVYFIPAGSKFKVFLSGKDGFQKTLSDIWKENSDSYAFSEGEHQIVVAADESKSYKMMGDGTPPRTKYTFSDTPIFQRGTSRFYGKGVTLTLEAKDLLSGVASVFYKENNLPYEKNTPLVHRYTHDGSYQIEILSCDQVGNEEFPAKFSFIYDTIPPESHLKFLGTWKDLVSSQKDKVAHVAGKDAHLEIMSRDTSSGVAELKFAFDDAPAKEYDTELYLDKLKEGAHFLTYFGKDHVENKESLKKFAFIYDPIPPEISLTFKGTTFVEEQVTYVNASTILQVTAVDRHSKVEKFTYIRDQEPEKSVGEKFELQKKDGLSIYTFKSSDLVDNEKHIEKKIFLDSTPPEVSFEFDGEVFWDQGIAHVQKNEKLTVQTKDDGSGLSDLQICETKCEKYQGPIPLDHEGQWKIKAWDKVGNTMVPKTLSIQIIKPKEGQQTQIASKKKWVSDPLYGVIGPKNKSFALQITDTPEGDKNAFFLDFSEKEFSKLWENQDGIEILKLSFPNWIATASIPIDDTPPVTKIHYMGAQNYRSGTKSYFSNGLKIQLEAKDPTTAATSQVDSTYYSINNQGYGVYGAVLSTFSLEKEYALAYYSVDRVGNKENVLKESFIIDHTPPQTEPTFKKPFFDNVTTPEGGILLSAKDNLSGVAHTFISFDQEPWMPFDEKKVQAKFKKFKEGPHQVKFYSVDQVGNTEKPKTLAFKMSIQPPLTSYEVLGKSYRTKEKLFLGKNAKVMINNANQSISGIEKRYYITSDRQKEEIYNGPFSFDQTNAFILSLYSVDRVGHVSKELKIPIQMDLSPPRSKLTFKGISHIDEDQIFISPSTKIVIDSKDTDSGVASIPVSIDGKEILYQKPIQFRDSEEHNISFYAEDHVGNTEAVQFYHVTIDKSPPEVSILGRDDIPVLQNKVKLNSYLYIDANDSQSGVKEVFYRINGQEQTLYRFPIHVTKEGLLKIEVICLDWLDNKQTKLVNYVAQK